MTPPPQQMCKTCEFLKEEPQEIKYRCEWNCCFMRPWDTCPCSPPHYKARSRPLPAAQNIKGCPTCQKTNCSVCIVYCEDKEHDAAIDAKAREQFIEKIEDKLPRYSSELGDMYLLSDIQELRHQEQPK